MSNHSNQLPRRQAAARHLRRRIKRGLWLIVVILAATFALNFFFNLGRYMPKVDEPKDLDREIQLRKKILDGEKKD